MDMEGPEWNTPRVGLPAKLGEEYLPLLSMWHRIMINIARTMAESEYLIFGPSLSFLGEYICYIGPIIDMLPKSEESM